MRIIKGDLIKLALEGSFDLICQGCNCQNTWGAGIALQMKKAFPDAYAIDQIINQHTHDKEDLMGQYSSFYNTLLNGKHFYILNLYTQLYPGIPSPGCKIPFDYEAFTTCLRKINVRFQGQHIGLPLIGCGLAGADRNKVIDIIATELRSMEITIVEYANNKTTQRFMAKPGLGEVINARSRAYLDGKRAAGRTFVGGDVWGTATDPK